MKEIIEERLLRCLRSESYRPMTKSELCRALEVGSDERADLRACLRRLEHDGVVLQAKKGRYLLQENNDQTVVGTYRRRLRDGELVTGKSDGGEIKVRVRRVRIADEHAGTALDGDRVVVRLRRRPDGDPAWLKHLPKDKQEELRKKFAAEPSGLDGEVVKVLERSARRLVGNLTVAEGWVSFAPDDERLPRRIDLPDADVGTAVTGDKALVRIESWESMGQAPRGVLLKVLGRADAPGVDVLAVIHKHGLPTDFPEDVLREAGLVTGQMTGEILAHREDWRGEEVLTIDPFDARDFDDAIAVKEIEGGGWDLAVHIADVSHYVPAGSALDREAERRGNSVYLVDRVLPMLPEALSNGICSLRPNEDRLTFCAMLTFDAEGTRIAARFFSAVICSMARLSYEEAYERLQAGTPSDSVTDALQRAWQLASLLRQKRYANGSLDLDFPETKVILDEDGKAREIRVVTTDESHQLIEECMLAANEAVAETILKAARPSLYRAHEDPDPDKLIEFRATVRDHGFQVGDLSHRQELQRFLTDLRGHPAEPVLKLALLKNLKRAVYSEHALGHYGLAKRHYTHFTSPIRRYTDLVVHRVLRSLTERTAQGQTLSPGAMGELAEHLSSTERLAAEAELETKRLKVMEYFERRWSEKPHSRYQVVVTEVSRMGLFVDIEGYSTRGLIRMGDLPGEDYYRLDARRFQVSAKKGRTYQVGDRLEAELIRVDRKQGHLDFRPVE